jgi:hypothetical protein
VVRFANVLVGEVARRLGFESTVGDLRRDAVTKRSQVYRPLSRKRG